MTAHNNVEHQFDLSGLKSGDTFLGCQKCWFQFDPATATKPKCPKCGCDMMVYTVTQEDIRTTEIIILRKAKPETVSPTREQIVKKYEWLIHDRCEAFRFQEREARKQAAIWIARAEQLEVNANDLVLALERVMPIK